ncbi:hypothetical protein QB910_000048 [Dabrowskivirus KKP3916]|uniref:F5/8 type C domain-containing protein n=1 Tax=Alicyclobacillus phage KKP_3916 TaxID=3040651 RepID=A0AAT9V7W4_9CAUD|nr:hypothetical protein QB910_000048 [Alicyclobacillus phage KKP 3916]
MAFPVNPADQTEYIDSDGVIYTYYQSDNRWVRSGIKPTLPDATDSQKGVIQLTGDLAGSASDPELAKTGVTAGVYKLADVTVDEKGRITYAQNGQVNIQPKTISGLETNVDITADIAAIKNTFRTSEVDNSSKVRMNNMVVDVFNDSNGINQELSVGCELDTVNKQVISNIIYKSTGYTFVNVQPSSTYNDTTPTSKLTDGDNGDATLTSYVGQSASSGASLGVQFNLGTPKTVYFVTAYFGSLTNNGIYYPKQVQVYGSNDNSNWTQLGEQDSMLTDSPSNIQSGSITVKLNPAAPYQYYKVMYTSGGQWTFISEVQMQGISTLITTSDPAINPPLQALLDAEYSNGTVGSVSFDMSADGGNTWTSLTPDQLTEITSTAGNSVVVRATLTGDATLTSLGYIWYDINTIQYIDTSQEVQMLEQETMDLLRTNLTTAKANNTPRYTWNNIVVDSFVDASGIDNNLSSGYYLDTINKQVNVTNGNAVIVTTQVITNAQPDVVMIDSQYTGNVTFDVSIDGGTTWVQNLEVDSLIDISSLIGTKLRIRANMSSGAVLSGLAFAWFSGDTGGLSGVVDPGTRNLINNLQANLLKTNFKVSALQNASKYSMVNTVIDDYNDTTGIDASDSSGWSWDNVNKQIGVQAGVKTYSNASDWDSMTQSQVQVINDMVQLSNSRVGSFSTIVNGIPNETHMYIIVHSYNVAVDNNGIAHVVTASKRYNACYNIDYFTISPNGTVSSIIAVTTYTSSGADSYNPSIVIDLNGTAHIVCHSRGYTTNAYNILYATVSPSGVVTSLWITKNLSYSSTYPSIAVDSNGTCHIVFQSTNPSYYNIAYVTVSQSGTVSTVSWLTNATYTSAYPSIAIDSNGGKHVVFHSLVYNSGYTNIAYIYIDSNGNASNIVWLTTSTSFSSIYADIKVDSAGIAHVVFQSEGYSSSYQNIAYLTVSYNNGNPTISNVTWITQSASANSYYPHIAVDSNGTSYITFHSNIYFYNYNNTAYVTVSNSGSVSSINWLTNSTSTTYYYPVISLNSGYCYILYISSLSPSIYASVASWLYQSSGSITGIVDAGKEVAWNQIVPNVTLPTGTAISLSYQISNDGSTWSNSTTVISGQNLSGAYARYLQFTVTLSTTNTSVTPTLNSLQVTWENGQAIIVSTPDTAPSPPSQIIVSAEYNNGSSGSVSVDISIDGGQTWTTGIPFDTLTDIESNSGTSVVSRVTLTNDATISSIGYSWD